MVEGAQPGVVAQHWEANNFRVTRRSSVLRPTCSERQLRRAIARTRPCPTHGSDVLQSSRFVLTISRMRGLSERTLRLDHESCWAVSHVGADRYMKQCVK